MTDSRPEITVRAEGGFVILKVVTKVFGDIPYEQEWPLSIEEITQFISDLGHGFYLALGQQPKPEPKQLTWREREPML